MSVSAAAVLSVMLAHPPWGDRDVKPEDREAALRPVAEAVASAARTPVEAAELLALGMHESHFALAVVRDGCMGLPSAACDSGKARGPWQLHEASCRAAYTFPAGTPDSVRAEARCAIAQLRFHGYRCREHALSPLMGSFAGFATGSKCHWAGAGERVLTTRRMSAELARAEARS